MKPLEFNEQIGRLRIKFGIKVYDDEFLKLAWKALERLPDGLFEGAVDLANAELRPSQPPMLPELQSFVERALAKRPRPKVTHLPCEECGEEGLGYLLFEDPDKPGQMAAHCDTCRNGTELQSRGYKSVEDVMNLGFSRKVYPREKVKRSSTPWPPALEGLLIKLGRGEEKGVAFGLTYNRLKRDEAEYLLDVARRKAWDEEWARELVARVPQGQAALRRMTGMITGRAG